MNILFIQEFIYLQNTRVYRLAEQLKINGCNTYYATLRPYIYCRNKEAFTGGYTMCKYIEFADAKDIIKTDNIDVVIFYNINKYFVDTGFYTKLMEYCQKENIKTVMSFGDIHSDYDKQYSDCETWVYKNADMVWFLSDIMKQKAIELFGSRENLHVIHGKIPKTWKAVVKENRWHYDPTDICIAYIGRVTDINKNRYINKTIKRLAEEKIAVDLFLTDKPKIEIPKSKYINLILDLEYKELIRQISFADYGLSAYSFGEGDKYKSWLNTALPNKFFDYLHARLPTINYYGQSMKDYIDKYNIGFTYYSIDKLIEKIKVVSEEQHNIWRKNISEDIYCFKDNEVKELLEGLFK